MYLDKIKELVNRAEHSVDADDPTETYLLLEAIRSELDKVQQDAEPVAWMHKDCESVVSAGTIERYPAMAPSYTIPLYTHPPQAQQQWDGMANMEMNDRELKQPGKVLTDEEIDRIAKNEYRTSENSKRLPAPDCEDFEMYNDRRAIEFAYGLRYARDNGYLAPAAGLTDEEIDSAAVVHDPSFALQRSFREGARYARDNGYLAAARAKLDEFNAKS